MNAACDLCRGDNFEKIKTEGHDKVVVKDDKEIKSIKDDSIRIKVRKKIKEKLKLKIQIGEISEKMVEKIETQLLNEICEEFEH